MGKIKKMDSITTFLGHDSTIEGTIDFKGIIRIDGKITGTLQSDDGTVIVGEKAVVNGDITVGSAIVMGEVNGNIDADSRVEIFSPGSVKGDIQAAVISIDPGGFFNGKCTMTSRITSLNKPGAFSDKSGKGDESDGKEKISKKL